jgi:hypothetical protein
MLRTITQLLGQLMRETHATRISPHGLTASALERKLATSAALFGDRSGCRAGQLLHRNRICWASQLRVTCRHHKILMSRQCALVLLT